MRKAFVEKPINISETLAIAKAIAESNIAASKIDIGKLTFEWIKEKKSYENIKTFINEKLKFIENTNSEFTPKDVILFGFGRIGRLLARELMSQKVKENSLD